MGFNFIEYYRKHDNRLRLLWILLLSGFFTVEAANADTLYYAASAKAERLPAGAVSADSVLPMPAVDLAALHRITEQCNVKRKGINIYDLPYSPTANYPDYGRIALNTGVLYAAGILAVGVLQALPEDATAWNKERITSIPFWQRWPTHIKKGPVWDNDSFVFNYILHPYGGAAYYMSARSQGCNIFYSALYSAAVSAIFWEYGIEAFMEIPSLQDLIITPFAGAIIGESFYALKRHIVAHGYTLFGSKLLGNVVAYVIDPVNEVVGLFAGNKCRQGVRQAEANGWQVSCVPSFQSAPDGGAAAGFSLSVTF